MKDIYHKSYLSTGNPTLNIQQTYNALECFKHSNSITTIIKYNTLAYLQRNNDTWNMVRLNATF